jgi:hypothetical protein
VYESRWRSVCTRVSTSREYYKSAPFFRGVLDIGHWESVNECYGDFVVRESPELLIPNDFLSSNILPPVVFK